MLSGIHYRPRGASGSHVSVACFCTTGKTTARTNAITMYQYIYLYHRVYPAVCICEHINISDREWTMTWRYQYHSKVPYLNSKGKYAV